MTSSEAPHDFSGVLTIDIFNNESIKKKGSKYSRDEHTVLDKSTIGYSTNQQSTNGNTHTINKKNE